MKMFGTLLLLCFAALPFVYGKTTFKILDTESPEVTDKACPVHCTWLMDMGLMGVNFAFNGMFKEIPFSSGICDCLGTGLNNFNYTESCSMNSAGDIIDHKVKMFFNNPSATCSCHLPNNPAAAAEKLTNSDNPVGKCGKDSVGDKLPKATFECQKDESQPETGRPIQLFAEFGKSELEATFRVDTTTGDAFPLYLNYISPEDNPMSLKEGPGFEKAWECLNSEEHRAKFVQKLFFHAYSSIFTCLAADKPENSMKSIIENLFYFGGKCSYFPLLGL